MRSTIALLWLSSCAVVPEALDPSAPTLGIELELVGNEGLGRKEILRALAFDLAEFEEQGYSRAAADDVAYALEAHYLSKGYRLAEVDELVTEPGGEVHLRLEVVEGPRTTIDEGAIRAEGVTAFKRAELLAFLNGPRLGTLGRGDLIFQESRVRTAVSAMAEEYAYRGYLDAKVAPIEITFSEDGKLANLTVRAEEGACYRVGRVRLAPGTPRLGDGSQLRRIVERFQFDEERKRRVFDPRLPFELRGELREMVAAEGRPDTRVTVSAARYAEAAEGPQVDLTITLEPGPLVTIGEIRFEGNELTGRNFLLSRLRLKPGDPFASPEARESLRRLYETSLFKSVAIDLVPSDDEQGDVVVRDLVVRLEEGPTREYWAEPGYGSYELFRLGIGARERNLLGTGRQLRAKATVAIRAVRAEVALTDPWFFGTDLILDVPLNFNQREHPSFVSRSTAVGPQWTKQWDGHRHSTSFGYKFKRSEVQDVEIVDALVAAALEDVDLSSINVVQRLDRRDNIFLPSSGSFASLSLEWGDRSIGSELDYVRTDLNLRAYRELIEDKLVLASAFRTGLIMPHGEDETIPLQERYFNGGENTVRAFGEEDLGPHDREGNPLGGEAQTIANLELRYRIRDVEFEGFEVALFADAGNVVGDASDWARFEDMRYGLGLGVRYILPVGPLRLDVGWNPEAEDGEDEFVPHFALGISF